MKQRIRYKKISRGVYEYITLPTKTGKILSTKTMYRVIRTKNGQRNEMYFTDKKKATAYSNSFNK